MPREEDRDVGGRLGYLLFLAAVGLVLAGGAPIARSRSPSGS